MTEETSSIRFNTGIAAMMEFVNGAYKWEERPRAALEQFVLLLAPYAPHVAEEMWQVLSSPFTLQGSLGRYRNPCKQVVCSIPLNIGLLVVEDCS